MSGLTERLRGLRQQAGQNAPRPTISSPASTELRRMLQWRAARQTNGLRELSVDREVPGEEISPGLRFTEACFDGLSPPATIDIGFARMGSVHSSQLLYFDTETTGLAGGTGTRAFMIGAGDWQAGRLRIRQLTLTRMAGEPAMLREFASWLRAGTMLVSYNGKCYDAPLLTTRYRLARIANPLQELAHLDLLHPVRRHWKPDWENCRLATAERKLLGVVREDDLPGAEAPAAWLTYLHGGSARNLRRVAAHNAQDLRSLAGILLRMDGLGERAPAIDGRRRTGRR